MKGNEKWIQYNNVELKRSWGKLNEPPPTTPKANLQPKKVYVYMVGLEKSLLLRAPSKKKQIINSKCCFQLGQPKAVFSEKVQN